MAATSGPYTSSRSGMRGGRLKAGGGRARAERTQNMPCMLVTLDVSKLSGWLKALADCRVERRACDAGRGAAREACEGFGWRRRNRHVQGGGRGGRLKAVERAERTWNMRCMLVTLDVSKLSGWLNTVAYCRVERRACNVGSGTAREA